jgi:hypothetical protein
MSVNGFMKRLEALAQSINVRHARQIIIEVDGNLPDDPATEDALLEPLKVTGNDLVVVIKKLFCCGWLAPSWQRHSTLTGENSNG